MHLHGTSEIHRLQYLTFIYIFMTCSEFFYENSCTIPTIKFFFLLCNAMKRMKYEKLLIQWTMHPHVKFEFRRLEYLIFIYIHDLLRFFLWKFLYFSYHKIFPSTLQTHLIWDGTRVKCLTQRCGHYRLKIHQYGLHFL